MPFIVKVTTSWEDSSLPIEERAAKVRDLYARDFVTDTFNPAEVFELRRKLTDQGDLLARGSIISVDGTQIVTTNVWKSEKAANAYSKSLIVQKYMSAMRAYGWNIEISFV